jgi:hypothetical protein
MIKPWPKVRALKDYEWKRDRDEDIQDTNKHRYIPAVFWKIEKDKPWYTPTDSVNPAGFYDEAIFQEEDGIKEFYLARRLVREFKIGDHVRLNVCGCCSVIDATLLRERR